VSTGAEQLLQALGGDADRPVTAESLLGQLTESDPTLALLAKLMLENGAPPSEPEPDAAQPADPGELEELRERNEALAAALGACFACWGADLRCIHCGGAGRPGAAQPDRRLFSQLVAPAVARFGARTPIDREGGRRE
jgi:hypothetical protein